MNKTEKPDQADIISDTSTEKLCPFFKRPFPDCHCVNLTSRKIPSVLKYCNGNQFDCKIYLRKTDSNEPDTYAINQPYIKNQPLSVEAYTMKDADSCRDCRSDQKSTRKQTPLEGCALRADLEKLSKMSAELPLSETLQEFNIASEMKDNIGQLILLARINLDLISDEKQPDNRLSELYTVRNLLDQALSGIRTLYSRLSPPLISESGLESTLEYLCLRMESENGLQVEFSDDGNEKSFEDVSSSIIMYHVAREILFNVARHVKECAVRLSMGLTGNCLQLVVEVPGAGYDFSGITSKHRKIGRLNIYQCIRQMGGNIRFSSIQGERTALTIQTPLARTGVVTSDLNQL
ncbi:MAG: hypothetical protein HXX11_23515 [Desulfuromonadales bacterium]|nr:hypothetical protein [Desulfuromonadales bacterium]